MSLATARPSSASSASGYLVGFAKIDFRDGRGPKPHPVILRSSDGLMVPVSHTGSRFGEPAIAFPANWANDGDDRKGFAKPLHLGRYPLTKRTAREGMHPLRDDLTALADRCFA